jgi:hypothetical protein
VEKGVPILEYTDDTIFLFQDDLEQDRNLKFIIVSFQTNVRLKNKLPQTLSILPGRSKSEK